MEGLAEVRLHPVDAHHVAGEVEQAGDAEGGVHRESADRLRRRNGAQLQHVVREDHGGVQVGEEALHTTPRG